MERRLFFYPHLNPVEQLATDVRPGGMDAFMRVDLSGGRASLATNARHGERLVASADPSPSSGLSAPRSVHHEISTVNPSNLRVVGDANFREDLCDEDVHRKADSIQ